MAEGIMVDLSTDFWIRETGTGQQMTHLHERYDDDDDVSCFASPFPRLSTTLTVNL